VGRRRGPIERVFALLACYRAALVRASAPTVPIGSLALELHEPDRPVRERLARNFDAWVGAIDTCLPTPARGCRVDSTGAHGGSWC
jgi:hypothetical protein